MNQEVINIFYQAADTKGQSGWEWLQKAGLTYLAADRNAPYSGPEIRDIPTLSAEEQDAIFGLLPMVSPTETVYTNQDVINAVYEAAGMRGQDGWVWLQKAGLTYLVNNREVLYSGPDLNSIQGFSDDERMLVMARLSGSGRTDLFIGSKYTVQFYKSDYPDRQEQAIADGCIAYVEQHFNAGGNANYSLVIIPKPNPIAIARDWAEWYAKRVAQLFGINIYDANGVIEGGFGCRGNGNIKIAGAQMPALLLESLFATNPVHAAAIRSVTGQNSLADSLVESIEEFFPQGGKIAFSVGHKYRTSNPRDRGVRLYGGGFEADYAEKVLLNAARKLQAL
ncbi:MAG: hypothetical protein AAF708_04420 [Deinococcota bacterium]